MAYIVYGLLILATLFQIVFFNNNLVPSLIVLLCCGVFISVRHFRRKEIKNAVYISQILLLAIIAVFGIVGTIKTYISNAGSFERKCERASVLTSDGKYNEAEDILAELEEEYGINDTLRLLYADNYYKQGDYTKAHEMCGMVENRDENYYLLDGAILSVMSKQSSEAYEELESLSEEAAQEYPEWGEMQKMCGKVKVVVEEYDEAKHYFSNAISLDRENGEAYFCLGVLYYYDKDYAVAKELLSKAKEFSITGEYLETADKYLKEIEEY